MKAIKNKVMCSVMVLDIKFKHVNVKITYNVIQAIKYQIKFSPLMIYPP